MTVTVLYFAAVRDLVGTEEERLTLSPVTVSVGEFVAHLATLHPALTGRLETVRVARNEAFVAAGDLVNDGDVVALIPPVAGG